MDGCGKITGKKKVRTKLSNQELDAIKMYFSFVVAVL